MSWNIVGCKWPYLFKTQSAHIIVSYWFLPVIPSDQSHFPTAYSTRAYGPNAITHIFISIGCTWPVLPQTCIQSMSDLARWHVHPALRYLHDCFATTNWYLFPRTYRMYASVYNAGLPVVNIGIACGSWQAFRYVTPSFLSNDIYVCLRLDNL